MKNKKEKTSLLSVLVRVVMLVLFFRLFVSSVFELLEYIRDILRADEDEE